MSTLRRAAARSPEAILSRDERTGRCHGSSDERRASYGVPRVTRTPADRGEGFARMTDGASHPGLQPAGSKSKNRIPGCRAMERWRGMVALPEGRRALDQTNNQVCRWPARASKEFPELRLRELDVAENFGEKATPDVFAGVNRHDRPPPTTMPQVPMAAASADDVSKPCRFNAATSLRPETLSSRLRTRC
ncbi:MAG: hypothetical protein ACREPL_12330 [Rhodanobacteraceae bacterium]